MTKPTYVTLLLDETGSMGSIKADVIGGFNEYIETLAKTGLDFRFTLVKWDSNHQTMVHTARPIAEVPKLNQDTYTPGASTPLIDVCVKGIRATEKQVEGLDVNVAIVIQTDGQENASVAHTQDELNALVKEKTALGWLFTYLGAGIDAFAEAAKYGIPAGQALRYGRHSNRQAFAGAARVATSYGITGQSVSSTFTDEERSAAADPLDPLGPPTPTANAPSQAVDLGQTQKPSLVDEMNFSTTAPEKP